MSADVESDSELAALRNELLTGLQKKQNKCPGPIKQTEETKDNADDDELEMLRWQALNAKRNKPVEQSDELRRHKTNIPGRFRYDKDSEEDDDEDDEDDLTLEGHSRPNRDTFDDDNEVVNKINDTTKIPDLNNNGFNHYASDCNENNPSEFNSFHCNYQTYRNECSKLMPNDEYEPNSLSSEQTSLPQGFDLRNFLREKAMRQQIENTSSQELGHYPEDLDYSEPITRPIEIKQELFYHKFKGKPYTKYNNNNNNNNSNNGKYYHCEMNRKYMNEGEVTQQVTQENEDETPSSAEESDEEFRAGHKKLRSVVAKAILSIDNKELSTNREDKRASYTFHKRK